MSIVTKKITSFVSALKGKGAVAIVTGNFLTKAAAFLGSIVLVRLMAKSDYGVLSSLENVYTYLYLLAGLGLNNAVLRWMVLKDTSSEKRGILDYAVTSGTAVNVVLVIGAVIGVCLAGNSFSNFYYLLPLMMIALPFHFLLDTGTFSLRALFRNRAFAILSVGAILFVWLTKIIGATSFGLIGVILSWPVAYFVIAAVVLCYLYFGIFRNIKGAPITRAEKRAMKRYSVQYMITNGMWALFIQNDLLMIGLITGSADSVADYKVASVFPMVLALLSSSIGMFAGPYFIKHENNKSWVWLNYKRVLMVSVGVIGVAALLLALLAEPLVLLVYGEQYANIVPLMIILLVGSVINNGVRYASANLIAAMGRIKANMVIAFCGICAQIAFNFLFISEFGVYGAAITGIVVQLGMAIAVTVYFAKTFRAVR